MVLDAALLKTQYYKVWIKDKVEQSRERSSTPLQLGVVAFEKEAFGSPSTAVANVTHIQWSLNKFPDFFRLGTFIDSTHMKL